MSAEEYLENITKAALDPRETAKAVGKVIDQVKELGNAIQEESDANERAAAMAQKAIQSQRDRRK